jgi:hypothetical protein
MNNRKGTAMSRNKGLRSAVQGDAGESVNCCVMIRCRDCRDCRQQRTMVQSVSSILLNRSSQVYSDVKGKIRYSRFPMNQNSECIVQ